MSLVCDAKGVIVSRLSVFVAVVRRIMDEVVSAELGTGNACTSSAFPMLAPGSEKTALGVWQHAVFSRADSQQYAPGSAYPWPTHSHTCTPPAPKSYAVSLIAASGSALTQARKPSATTCSLPPSPRAPGTPSTRIVREGRRTDTTPLRTNWAAPCGVRTGPARVARSLVRPGALIPAEP